VDASWQTANVAGEEALGGTAPTPDQDIVDNLGVAAGLTYRDDEPLNSDKKVLDRDRNRWELNPASARNEEEDELEEEDLEEDEDLEDDLDDLEDLEEDELDGEEEEDEEDLDELEEEDDLLDDELEEDDEEDDEA
jgi:hypothetical protein